MFFHRLVSPKTMDLCPQGVAQHLASLPSYFSPHSLNHQDNLT
jgi:hypothetical protein